MRYRWFRRYIVRKTKDGTIRIYGEPRGRYQKFEFLPADGSAKQTKILGGQGTVEFSVPGSNRLFGIEVTPIAIE